MADHQTEKKKRLKELTDLLNRAGKAYYQDAEEIMSNYEYDALYDELEATGKRAWYGIVKQSHCQCGI